MIRIQKWKYKREYAVYEDEELLAVTAYKKGAVAVAARVGELTARIEALERELRAAQRAPPLQLGLPLGA